MEEEKVFKISLFKDFAKDFASQWQIGKELTKEQRHPDHPECYCTSPLGHIGETCVFCGYKNGA